MIRQDTETEWRPLRLLAYCAWVPIILFLAGAVEAYTSGKSVEDSFYFRYLTIPLWFALAANAAYYVHLLLRHFRPALALLIAITLIGSVIIAVTWLVMGSVHGITVALACPLYMAYSLTWSGAVREMLQADSLAARVGLSMLGFAIPPSTCGLVFSLWICWRMYDDLSNYGVKFPAGVGVFGAASVLVLGVAAVVSWRARREAQKFLHSGVLDQIQSQK